MRLIFTIFICLLGSQLFSQDKSSFKWFKGNTHTHSYWSDGNDFPEMIMNWYKVNGYDFISLSDHNTLAEGEKWKRISKHPFRQRGFKRYLEKYGEDWVNYKEDSAGNIDVKLKTLNEYRPLFEEENEFLIMQAEEVTDKYNGKPLHMGAINLKQLIEPQGGTSVANVLQNNLDAVYEQRKRTGQPMFPHINHPNYRKAVSVADMLHLKGNRFFEVYNGHPHVHNYGDSSSLSMDELWDVLLIKYIEQGKPLVYGLATDDAHNFLEYRIGTSNPGRGWIMVRASELTPEALIESMENGHFYASSGVVIKNVGFKNNRLHVKVKQEKGVDYFIQFWGAKNAENRTIDRGVLLKEVKGTKANYKLKEEDLYVRAKVISSKLKANPYQEGDVETAWIQPVTRNSLRYK